mgnify:CR=1 FL=1
MIYLDYNATTPVDKKVLETFNKVCINYPGNSNSLHKLGIKSKELCYRKNSPNAKHKAPRYNIYKWSK